MKVRRRRRVWDAIRWGAWVWLGVCLGQLSGLLGDGEGIYLREVWARPLAPRRNELVALKGRILVGGGAVFWVQPF